MNELILNTEQGEAQRFDALGLSSGLLSALSSEGYVTPTPIQLQAIPHLLQGLDLVGCAQTGTGKTAAFLLPLLDHLSRGPREPHIKALILAPTRELAAQIGERASAYGQKVGIRHTVIFGGVGQKPQEVALRARPNIVIATPGRLLDLMNQGHVNLEHVEYFVLDEADRMLDMGFIHDVRRVMRALPKVRQNVLFSATFPDSVETLAKSFLHEPVRVSVAPPATTTERVTQGVYFVGKSDKRALLEKLLVETGATRSLVFTRTKHGANRIAEQLTKAGFVAMAIHGNKSQNARERALSGFRDGTVPVLCATDIAARGIDVEAVSHVFNFDLPNEPESYVHRIGRTGRAAASGAAIALCDPSEEMGLLRDIEKTIRMKIPVLGGDPRAIASAPQASDDEPRRGFSQRGSSGRSQGSSRGSSRGSSYGASQSSSPATSQDRRGGADRSSSGPSRDRSGGRGSSSAASTSSSSAARPSPSADRRPEPQLPARPSEARGESRPRDEARPRPEGRRDGRHLLPPARPGTSGGVANPQDRRRPN